MTETAALSTKEATIRESVTLDHAWSLVEEFTSLVREAGSEDERVAADSIMRRLDEWGIAYELHEPTLLISLPREASLTFGGVEYHAKTPAMSASTPDGGVSGTLVYEQAAHAKNAADILNAKGGDADVAGKIVLTEGLPLPPRVADLSARGAAGVVYIAPGDRIHEGVSTPIWGSPDLTSYGRNPTLPVVSVSKPDGDRIIEALAAGGGEATLVARHVEEWRPIPIIVAEIRGTVEPDRFVLVHGHLDSWHVGIGDNATGDATMLELARVLNEHRDSLPRTVRVAWWSGHSQGRYAGSTWFADAFALDLERNCVCHINCDSPGCRDAEVYEDVPCTAELTAFGTDAIRDFAGAPSTLVDPFRGGDASFSNLGISTFLMLSSTMSAETAEAKGCYTVGGCGGNIEWHTEADTIEVADRDVLLRDMQLYTGTAFRAATTPLHPLDFRRTVAHIEAQLQRHAEALAPHVDLAGTFERARALTTALDRFYAAAGAAGSVEAARPFNDALLKIARPLVSVLYSRAGTYRQDPALHIALLPEIAGAAQAIGTVPDGVVRTEALRARNRLDAALDEAAEHALRVG
jgi:N-acetylated-alpha-linked acidic dipeptidase